MLKSLPTLIEVIFSSNNYNFTRITWNNYSRSRALDCGLLRCPPLFAFLRGPFLPWVAVCQPLEVNKKVIKSKHFGLTRGEGSFVAVSSSDFVTTECTVYILLQQTSVIAMLFQNGYKILGNLSLFVYLVQLKDHTF